MMWTCKDKKQLCSFLTQQDKVLIDTVAISKANVYSRSLVFRISKQVREIFIIQFYARFSARFTLAWTGTLAYDLLHLKYVYGKLGMLSSI